MNNNPIPNECKGGSPSEITLTQYMSRESQTQTVSSSPPRTVEEFVIPIGARIQGNDIDTLLLNLFNENNRKKYCDVFNAVKYYFTKNEIDLSNYADYTTSEDALLSIVSMCIFSILRTYHTVEEKTNSIKKFISIVSYLLINTEYPDLDGSVIYSFYDYLTTDKKDSMTLDGVISTILADQNNYNNVQVCIEMLLDEYNYHAGYINVFSMCVYSFLHSMEQNHHDTLKRFLLQYDKIQCFHNHDQDENLFDAPEKCIEYIKF
jgi:hypothetical protein